MAASPRWSNVPQGRERKEEEKEVAAAAAAALLTVPHKAKFVIKNNGIFVLLTIWVVNSWIPGDV